MRCALLAGLLMLAPTAAPAAELVPCNWMASAERIVEPWHENTAIAADGLVRLALLDVGEPAAASFHLLVLSPDPRRGRICTIVSARQGEGFGWIDFDQIEVVEVPAGLMFAISTFYFNDAQGIVDLDSPVYLHLIVDPFTGTLRVEEHL